MVHGIVDLTATGTTLRENGLVIREEIMRLDRAADRQPGLLPRQGGGDRRGRGAPACGAEDAAPSAPPRSARCVPPGASVAADVADDRRRGPRGRRRRGAASYEAALRRGARRRCGLGPPTELPDAALEIALDGLDPTCAPGSRSRSPTCARSPRPGSTTTGSVTLPEGQTVTLREVPVRRAAVYAPSGRNPYPSHGRHGRDHRARRGRRRGLRRHRAAPDDPRRGAAVRGRRRVRASPAPRRSPRSPTAPSRSRRST